MTATPPTPHEIAALPSELAEAKAKLLPCDDPEGLAWITQELSILAMMWGVDPPEGEGYDRLIETLAKYPRASLVYAFERAADEIEQPSFRDGRFPAPGSFTKHIRAEYEKLKAEVNCLTDFERHLSTLALKARWAEEARERHAAVKARERAQWRRDDPET